MSKDTWKAAATNDHPHKNETLLDDFLWTIYKSRQQYALPKSKYRRAQLSEYVGYDQTLQTIVERIIQRHGQGQGIFSRPHPLLDELGIVLEDRSVLRKTYRVRRFPKDLIQQSLEKILELAGFARLQAVRNTAWSRHCCQRRFPLPVRTLHNGSTDYPSRWR